MKCPLCSQSILLHQPTVSVLGYYLHDHCYNTFRQSFFNQQFSPPQFMPSPISRYEAFQRLGPRAMRAISKPGGVVQAHGYRFTQADYLHPPQPPPRFVAKSFKWRRTPLTIFDDPEDDTEEDPEIKPEEMPSVTPHLIVDKDRFEVVTPYNKPFIDALKKSLLNNERRYIFDRRVWEVKRSETNVQIVKDLIEKHFGAQPQMFSKQGDIQATYDTAIDVTNNYAILGVTPEATQEEIKQAFRKVARRLHPDTSEADAEFFILAKKAYDILKDPRKRKKYDLARRLMSSRLENETGLRLTSRDTLT